MAAIPIRIGIIGAGGIFKRRHFPGLAKIDDCQVVAVHNRRRESAEAVAREYGIPHVVDSPEAVYTRDDINAVFIGTYPNLHRDLTLAALEHGKHVFCQARMARNLAEARDMAAAAKQHPDLVTQICIGPRILAVEPFLKKLIADGELGELRLVRLTALLGDALDPETPMHWRFDKELSGNQIMSMGIYVEEFNRIYGPARTVSAAGKVFTTRRKDAATGEMRNVEIPETVCITGELENGAHYVYNLSSVSAFAPGPLIEVYGTRGTFVYEVESQTVRMGRVGSDEALAEVPIPKELRGEWSVEADFASAIRNGTPVVPDFEEGLRYMQFVEAVAVSLAEGRQVRLPLP